MRWGWSRKTLFSRGGSSHWLIRLCRGIDSCEAGFDRDAQPQSSRGYFSGAFLNSQAGVNLELSSAGRRLRSPIPMAEFLAEGRGFVQLVVGADLLSFQEGKWSCPQWRMKRPNGLIWLFQAVLFTLGHIYYLKDEAFVPRLIRIMLPALLTGFIAWQARSIFTSMVTHGVFNASADMLLHTRSLSEAIHVSWSAAVLLTGLLVGVWILEWLRHRRASAIYQ